MNGNVTLTGKRFISLKWRALILTSALLVIVFSVFLFFTRYSGQVQLNALSKERAQRYVGQFEALLRHQQTIIESYGRLLPQIQGVQQAILGADSTIIEQAVEPFWQRLTQDSDITSLVVFSPQDRILLWQGDPSIPPDLMEKFQLDRQPRSALSCFETCEIYVAVPLLIQGWGNGMVVFGARLDQVVKRFEAVSNSELILAIRRDQRRTQESDFIEAWGTDLNVNSTESQQLELLRDLSSQHSRGQVYSGLTEQSSGNTYREVLLRPLRGAVFPRQGELFFITDISPEILANQAQQRTGFIFGLAALIFAELMLLITLWGALNRLRTVASKLPQLATEKLGQVRHQLASFKRDQRFADESDILISAAVNLSHQLEDLERELRTRAEELELRSEDLQTEKQFVQSILDTAHAVILTQDRNGVVTLVNQHCTRMTGFDLKQLVGHTFYRLLPHDENLPDIRFQLNELAHGARHELHHESAMVCNDGSSRHMSWHHSLLPGAKIDQQILSIALDISERKEAEDRLGWLATHDPLTGLFNRRRFGEELQKSISHAKRYNRPGAILFFDLDQFKDVNDTSGHKVGDELLRRVSERLRIEARDTDLIFRLGGDEFAMLIREVDESAVTTVASRLCEALTGIEVLGTDRVHRVSTSIGVALFPEHGEFTDELVANADIAMYQAKASGRNGWHIYSPAEQDRERTHERVYWNEMVKEALSKDTLQVAFQPIQTISTGTVSHYEALLRVSDETGQLLPTFKFIQSAEASGLIQEVDLRIVDKVLAYKRQLESRSINATFAINLSGISFRNPTLYQSIAKKLREYQVNPAEIIFEITETSALEDGVATANKMRDIKKLGCKFALDDFGVGFSSIYHIKQLPIDLVKIDGSFIRHLEDEPEDQALVRAVVEVAKVFGLQTVAEFVENEAILEILHLLKVDYAQGYHISRPEYFETLWGEVQGEGKAGG